jgi:CubicO group peptidase (beta-lactamase class C family)
MSVQTINPWMSSGKPITALAVLQLWERGKLQLDDRVSEFIPEFTQKGKEPITIRHLLTHMGGFRAVIGLKWDDPWEVAIEKICYAPLEPRWIIGRTAGYHAAASWYILGEIVRRIDGRPIDQYARAAIFLPLGMNDCWIGIPQARYEQYGERVGLMFETDGDTPQPASPGSTAADAAAIRPGANARGPIRELGRFYEMLMNHGRPDVIGPQTVEAMVARHRAGVMDLTFKAVIDMGLGLIINSSHYSDQPPPYGYGPHAGLRTFGHSGQLSSCAFCDPDARLVVAWICNGMPAEAEAHRRQHELNAAIYEDILV